MQRTIVLPRPLPEATGMPTWQRLLRRAWRAWDRLTLDADERFLRGASDLADLEWRLRRLERGRAERFGPFDTGA